MTNPYAIQANEAKLALIKHLESDAGWKIQEKTKGIQVFHKKVRGDKTPMVKGVCVIPRTPTEILSVLGFDHRKKYDDKMDKGKVIDVIDKNTKVSWNSVITPMFVTARDFCLVSVKAKVGDVYVLAAKSTKHKKKPKKNKPVRGDVKLGGWYLEPQGTSTKCSFVTWADLGFGNMVAKKARAQMPMLLAKVRDYMKKKGPGTFTKAANKIEQDLVGRRRLIDRLRFPRIPGQQ